MSRSRRSALTFASGLGYTAITLVVGIIAVPLLLRWLGTERYGAWRAVVDWFAYLTLLELGLAEAIPPVMAKAWGRSDIERVKNTLAAGIRAYAYVAAPMMVIGLGLTAALTTVVPVTAANELDLRRAGLLMVLGMLVVPLTPFRALAEARQEGYRVNVLLLVQSLVITGTALLLAWRGWGITGQAAAAILGLLVFFGGLAVHGLRKFSGALARVLHTDATREAWSNIWRLNTPTLIRQLTTRVSLLSDRIIVAAMLGPQMVVPLYITQRLAELAQGQITGIPSATWAALSELHAQGRHETYNQRLVELTRLVAVLGAAVLVPIAAYNQHFIARWVGLDRYAGDAVTAVSCGNAFLLAIVVLWDWCFSGVGKIALLVPLGLVSAVINLSLSLALTPTLGVLGPLVGTLVSVVLTSAWYLPILLRRTFGTPVRPLIFAVATPLAWAVPYFGASWWIAQSHDPSGWLLLLSELAAWPLIFLSLFWFLGIHKGRRSEYAKRVRSILKHPNE